MTDGPCAGLRVLDLGRGPVAAVATMVLADCGADVIAIEPPGGDPLRAHPAAPVWLRGKRSVSLDLKTPAAVEHLHALAATADVVVAAHRPGTAARLGADYATLAALNPRLVYGSITAFGPEGPYARYPGYEGIVAAKSGRMMVFAGQSPRPGPAYAAVPVGSHAAAQMAVTGIVAALLVRERTGRGQLVETSLLQGMLAHDWTGLLVQQLQDRYPDQFAAAVTPALDRQPTLQYQPVLTQDGRWIQLGGLMEHHFHAFLAAAALDALHEDPRFAGVPALDEEPREAVRALMLERIRERPLPEWMARFLAERDVAAEPIAGPRDALDHPQLRHNGDAVETLDPRLGVIRAPGPVARYPATPAVPGTAIPEPGEHTRAVLAEVAGRLAPPTAPASSGPPPRHPLDGVTIVEFATMLATPLAVAVLADLGARVIKVETLDGDIMRRNTHGVVAAKTTTGKESICLDLKAERGRAIARQLIERADALVHNFRAGVADRLGIGYEQVRQYHPSIVYVTCAGYGTDGPSAHRPMAHPLAGAATGGVRRQLGRSLDALPLDTTEQIREAARGVMRANEPNPDPNSSMLFATAIMLGLYVKQTRGIGQHIQTNMLLANAYANLDQVVSYAGIAPPAEVDAGLHGLHALYRLYPTAEGWVFLACSSEDEWHRLCAALDRSDLAADPRFRDAAARRANDAALAETLAVTFLTRTADEWETLLTGHDLGCVRADRDTPGTFFLADPHVAANDFTREADHALWGAYRRHGPAVTLAESPGRYAAGAVAGQHTAALLAELGYSPDDIAELGAARIVRIGLPTVSIA